jgi:hypothetical protein
MVSQIKVNEIIKQSGSSISIGESGDTITLPSTATLSNFPNNTPYFRVFRDGVQSLGNNTRTTIQFNTKTVDSGNYFDLSTYRYTPLVAGYYLFSCAIKLDTATDSNNFVMYIRKNGTEVLETSTNSEYYNSTFGTLLIEMNGTTDYVDVAGNQNTGGAVNLDGTDKKTFFHGNRIIT